MKIKSLLIGMLASTAFVACTNDVETVENGADAKGEKSYLAVNLNYAGVNSRAEGETTNFVTGSAAENAVNNVSFFFFNAAGEAYVVTGTGSNRLDKGYEELTVNSGNVNVEEISKPILVIEESDQVPPQKIVAVLNCPISETNISLSALQSKVGAYNTITVEGDNAGTYFVMSNSVYKHAVTGEEVVATDIPASSISSDATTAKANPVTIYVERVAAKVTVSANYTTGNTAFSTGVKTSENKDIYAKITGWEVVNAKTQTRLLKDIDPAWTYTWFNDAVNFRSYWAENTADENIKRSLSWGMTNESYRYYYENTDVTTVDEETTTQLEGNQSYLLVKAEFVDAATDGKSLAGKIAEWYGAKYTLDALKKQFADAVATQIFVKTGDKTAVSIKPEHITFFQEEDDADEKRYLCYAMLNPETTKGLVFVSGVNENGEFDTLEADDIKTILATIRPAKIWEAGGYYYLPIAHNSTVNGLVRNHVYQMNINGITGLGTPVYDPKKLIKPEKPTDDESFIAAEIKVLSWKVVNNGVVLN